MNIRNAFILSQGNEDVNMIFPLFFSWLCWLCGNGQSWKPHAADVRDSVRPCSWMPVTSQIHCFFPFLPQIMNIYFWIYVSEKQISIALAYSCCFLNVSLKYSWFTMLCECLVYSRVTQLTCIYSFPHSFTLWFIPWYWI